MEIFKPQIGAVGGRPLCISSITIEKFMYHISAVSRTVLPFKCSIQKTFHLPKTHGDFIHIAGPVIVIGLLSTLS